MRTNLLDQMLAICVINGHTMERKQDDCHTCAECGDEFWWSVMFSRWHGPALTTRCGTVYPYVSHKQWRENYDALANSYLDNDHARADTTEHAPAPQTESAQSR